MGNLERKICENSAFKTQTTIITPEEIIDGAVLYSVITFAGTAVSTFAAQNYGKGDLGRVRQGVRQSLGIAVNISVALTALVFLFCRHFLALFIDPSETEIIASAMRYIRTTSLFYAVLGVNYIARFSSTGRVAWKYIFFIIHNIKKALRFYTACGRLF